RPLSRPTAPPTRRRTPHEWSIAALVWATVARQSDASLIRRSGSDLRSSLKHWIMVGLSSAASRRFRPLNALRGLENRPAERRGKPKMRRSLPFAGEQRQRTAGSAAGRVELTSGERQADWQAMR